jgi:hypothetical protein
MQLPFRYNYYTIDIQLVFLLCPSHTNVVLMHDILLTRLQLNEAYYFVLTT